MLTFKLFGYPVRVQWLFWLLCLFLGMNFLQRPGPEGIGLFLIMTAVVFGSIIWHELGHAWARKKSGAPYSEIMLHGFGGLCSGPGQFTRGQSIFIAAAGPAASLLLGAATWAFSLSPAEANPWIRFFIAQMLWVNVGWAILNLLPIYPLDGGQIFYGIAGPRNQRTVFIVGMILAGLLAIAGLALRGSLFMAVLFGLLAYSNWQRLQGQQGTF
ncbi:MAG: site-2 protease family protein [Verrucomicrobiota bacterium]